MFLERSLYTEFCGRVVKGTSTETTFKDFTLLTKPLGNKWYSLVRF